MDSLSKRVGPTEKVGATAALRHVFNDGRGRRFSRGALACADPQVLVRAHAPARHGASHHRRFRKRRPARDCSFETNRSSCNVSPKSQNKHWISATRLASEIGVFTPIGRGQSCHDSPSRCGRDISRMAVDALLPVSFATRWAAAIPACHSNQSRYSTSPRTAIDAQMTKTTALYSHQFGLLVQSPYSTQALKH